MSTIPVYTLLNTVSPSIPELGYPTRVYPDVIAQADTIPIDGGAVTYSVVTGHPEDYIDAAADMDSVIVTVNVWALTSTVCGTLYDKVRRVLENGGRNCIVRFNPDDFEPDTQRFRMSFDIQFWCAR